jgi:hypothetical protein
MLRLLHTLAAATLALAASTVHAANVTIKFDNPIFSGTPGRGYDDVHITFPGIGGSPRSQTVYAGRFQGTASNLVGVVPGVFVDSVDDVFMYCYDLYDGIGAGRTVDYTIKFGGEYARRLDFARTLDFLGAVNAVNAMRNARAAAADPYAWLHPATAVEAAAIQLGIWESKYDTGWDIGGGAFSATGLEPATRSALSDYFRAIDSNPPIDPRFVMTLEAKGAQDMIAGDPPAAVPVPGTLWLTLGPLALLASGKIGRRVRRRAN